MRSQRGLAVVTALLVVAVAASAAALMLSQQSAMLDQTSMVSARAQADAYAQAGLDWARGVLLADRREIDSLDEPWAQPIAALPVERAIVGGVIVDEQGKLDLNNLAVGGPQAKAAHDMLQELLARLSLSRDLADAVGDWVDKDDESSPAGAENVYYLALPRPYRAANQPMVQVEELYRVRGFDAATVAKLRAFVTALPRALQSEGQPTPINVNTASEMLVGAALGLPPDKAAALLAPRKVKPFTEKSAFLEKARAAGAANVQEAFFDVKSSYFSVRVQVAQDDVQIATEALLRRGDKGVDVAWRRPRY